MNRHGRISGNLHALYAPCASHEGKESAGVTDRLIGAGDEVFKKGTFFSAKT
jgi:hypothetical protein